MHMFQGPGLTCSKGLAHRVGDVEAAVDRVAAHAAGAAQRAVQGHAVLVARGPRGPRDRRHPALKDVPHAVVVGVGHHHGPRRQHGDARRPRELRLVLRAVAVAAHAARKSVRAAVALQRMAIYMAKDRALKAGR